ncbi:rhodanese-related sulfurtransferase [Variovorax boronicumulans]|jgi:rhodanese-related sulfurtransferase|uniref:Rhodanese-related sulfurtransferase n=1 Tax=Variovorax boronicumulans TaxID=436515 RepID=A0AAW8D8W4_9BURK|nr:rhodanese-like domain-containing protein [Variovorax boronicumulans]MDP9897014.1 rhodanese-related sulfurtransferase [Variovorax boronicumulans]MDP9989709.1 rhodanese-related sulfurtransferase [Variovorax boronicumulans]MDQ0005605.1 rhodanese-related sulfurtransferase [Variovorax boronicumulans]MDQ0057054.1 rhodanese-related sulfurtransferase [Variovorax boronicumulans]
MIDQVRPADLAAWFAQDADATPVLLDVREPWELQTASVAPAGFTLVAIPMNEIPGRLAELGEGQRIACLCHHGARSQRVAAFLNQNGFDQLANVAGGIDAWSSHDPSVPRY